MKPPCAIGFPLFEYVPKTYRIEPTHIVLQHFANLFQGNENTYRKQRPILLFLSTGALPENNNQTYAVARKTMDPPTQQWFYLSQKQMLYEKFHMRQATIPCSNLLKSNLSIQVQTLLSSFPDHFLYLTCMSEATSTTFCLIKHIHLMPFCLFITCNNHLSNTFSVFYDKIFRG